MPQPARRSRRAAYAAGSPWSAARDRRARGDRADDRRATWQRVVVGVVSVAVGRLLRGDPDLAARSTPTERSRVWSFIPLFVCQRGRSGRSTSSSSPSSTIYSDKRLDREPVRLGDAGLLGAVDQPGLHHRAVAGVFAAIWTRLGPRQPSPRSSSRLGTVVMGVAFLLFLPIAGGEPDARRCCWLVGDPVRLHHRRAADLTGRAVAVDQARAGGVPHPDGGAVLPLGRARHRDGRHARRLLRPGPTRPATSGSLGAIAVAIGAVVLVFTKPITAADGRGALRWEALPALRRSAPRQTMSHASAPVPVAGRRSPLRALRRLR